MKHRRRRQRRDPHRHPCLSLQCLPPSSFLLTPPSLLHLLLFLYISPGPRGRLANIRRVVLCLPGISGVGNTGASQLGSRFSPVSFGGRAATPIRGVTGPPLHLIDDPLLFPPRSSCQPLCRAIWSTTPHPSPPRGISIPVWVKKKGINVVFC